MKEAILQALVVETLSVYGIFHFGVINESAMMILNTFKIPKTVIAKIINGLKKRGLVPGIPDLLILHNKTIYFMEFKVDNKKMSRRQIIVSEELVKLGYKFAVIRSYEGAMAQLRDWGIL